MLTSLWTFGYHLKRLFWSWIFYLNVIITVTIEVSTTLIEVIRDQVRIRSFLNIWLKSKPGTLDSQQSLRHRGKGDFLFWAKGDLKVIFFILSSLKEHGFRGYISSVTKCFASWGKESKTSKFSLEHIHISNVFVHFFGWELIKLSDFLKQWEMTSCALVIVSVLISNISLWFYAMLFQTHGDISTDDSTKKSPRNQEIKAWRYIKECWKTVLQNATLWMLCRPLREGIE